MPDLTLKEALEQYEAECREVLGKYDGGKALLEIMSPSLLPHLNDVPSPSETYCELIGACVLWLAGKAQLNMFWQAPKIPIKQWPVAPLRFFLNEVREHMQ